ncbi:MAG TPA: fumarylacetoacetate hydrolase family protein [Pseudomonadales bacterium]|nr:fumarylacetoacetate hydrolase family protein [Pseudomonadales bacterium]
MYTVVLNDQLFPYPVGKCVCVGRNYAAHATELNNPVPSQPLLFIKPADAAVPMAPQISIPSQYGSVHHELEIAVVLQHRLKNATESQVRAAIAGVGLALDLTLRDVQEQLKKQGHPWEAAKAFDGSSPLSNFVSIEQVADLANIEFSLKRNGETQQQGNSKDMLFAIVPLIAYMSSIFTLNPGDVILTGTPVGVGPLETADILELQLAEHIAIETVVV